jgi:hypothetical protein
MPESPAPAAPALCKAGGCTAPARWWPVINAWPKRGPLRFAVTAPISVGIDVGVCRAHTFLYEAGIRADWRAVIQSCRKQGLPTPERDRAEFVWVDTTLPTEDACPPAS